MPTTIQTTNGASIGSVSAGGAIIADIISDGDISGITAGLTLSNGIIVDDNLVSVTGAVDAPNGTIGAITTGSFIDANISTRTIANSVNVDGDYARGSIALSQPLAAGSEIRIGGSLSAASSINIPAVGLAGQIVVNNNDAGGEWLGDVNVGSVALADPMYTATAASLGGGSIGKAPFGLHDESSTPINGLSIPVSPTTIESVRMRYYGPLDDGGVSAGGGTPFTVDRRTTIPTGSWTPVAAASFSSAIVGNEVVITEATSGAFEPGFQYRFTATSALKSAGVAGTPVVLAEPYIVGMVTQGTGGGGGSCEDCMVCLEICELGLEMVGPGPDFNGDGVVGAYDLQLMLAAMGKPGGKADLNGDGVVDSVDLELFLTVYGSGEQVSSE